MKTRIFIGLAYLVTLSTIVPAQDTSRVFLSMKLGKKFVYVDSTKSIVPGIPDSLELWNVFGDPTNNDSPWKQEVDKNGLRVYTRAWPESDFIAAKYIDTIHAPIKQVIAVLYDVAAYDEWAADNMDYNDILEWDREAQYVITYTGIDMQWPVSDRDAVMLNHYYQDPITNIVTSYGRSVEGIVPEKEGYLRITKSITRGTLIPIDENTTISITEGHAEPGGLLLAWLVNFFIHEVSVKVSKAAKAQVAKEKYKTMDVPWFK